MGDWDYYCIICGAPFTARLASRSHEQKLPFFNRSRHLWLARFRILGRNKEYSKAKKCYLSGHVEHESYGGAGPPKGNDPALVGADIEYFAVYHVAEEEPWCHAIHDSCLMLFAKALKLQQTEETAPLAGSPAVDKDTLYDVLLESQTIWPSCFGQGIKYYELNSARREQYWSTPPDAHPFVLDPLHIPEIEDLMKRLPTIPQPGKTVTQAPTNLPAEIVNMILSHLDVEDQANTAESTIFSPTFFIPWREKLALEMSFIFEFESQPDPRDRESILINWARLYHMCNKDASLLRSSISCKERSGMLEQPVPDIDPRIAATARDVFVTYVSSSATDYDADEDVNEDAIGSDDRNRRWSDCASDADSEETNAHDTETDEDASWDGWNTHGLPGPNPQFPGLANRQRIWSTLQPLVDRYLAKTVSQRRDTSWFENNSIHMESLCFDYPDVAYPILHEDNRVDTVILLDDLNAVRSTSIEAQLCYNDRQVLSGIAFKISNGSQDVLRSFGHLTDSRSNKADFRLAELDNVTLTLRGFDDASRAVSLTAGVVGIAFGLADGRSISCGDQTGAKRYFISREDAIITGFSGSRDTRFRHNIRNHRLPVTEQFLNFGVMRHRARSEQEELDCETYSIEDLLWKEPFSGIPYLQLGSNIYNDSTSLVPFEVLRFENGSRSARNIVRFGATFCSSTIFKGDQVPVWAKYDDDRKASCPQALFIEYDDGSRVHIGKIRGSDVSRSIEIDGPGGERIARLGNVNKPVMNCRTITTNYGRRFHLGGSQTAAEKWGIKDTEYGQKIGKENDVSMSIKGLVAGWKGLQTYRDEIARSKRLRPQTISAWTPNEDTILAAITTFGDNLDEPKRDS